jgi:CheY-like chemotaxis protein
MSSTAVILLVDDEPTSRYLMAALLVDMGYAVTSAASGDEAMHVLQSKEACDLLLSDVVMPGMSGVELARQSREARPGLPAVLVTGKAEGWRTALEEGALAMSKPVNRERLANVLSDALRTPPLR